MERKLYLTIKECIEITHCSDRHLREEIKKKKLVAYKPGKELLVKPEDLDKWIKKKIAS